MLKRAWINRKYVIRTSFKWTGVIFAILGFIGIFLNIGSGSFPQAVHDNYGKFRVFYITSEDEVSEYEPLLCVPDR